MDERFGAVAGLRATTRRALIEREHGPSPGAQQGEPGRSNNVSYACQSVSVLVVARIAGTRRLENQRCMELSAVVFVFYRVTFGIVFVAAVMAVGATGVLMVSFTMLSACGPAARAQLVEPSNGSLRG